MIKGQVLASLLIVVILNPSSTTNAHLSYWGDAAVLIETSGAVLSP